MTRPVGTDPRASRPDEEFPGRVRERLVHAARERLDLHATGQSAPLLTLTAAVGTRRRARLVRVRLAALTLMGAIAGLLATAVTGQHLSWGLLGAPVGVGVAVLMTAASSREHLGLLFGRGGDAPVVDARAAHAYAVSHDWFARAMAHAAAQDPSPDTTGLAARMTRVEAETTGLLNSDGTVEAVLDAAAHLEVAAQEALTANTDT